MPIVVIAITEEGTEVAFQSDDTIDVCIFDLTSDDLYLHNEQTCRVTGVNDDGTINIKYTSSNHRVRYNVPASEVVLYYCEDDDIDSEVD
jgi:hypothetical protein